MSLRLAIICSGQAGQRRDMLDGIFVDPALRELREAASEQIGEDVASWWRRLDDAAIYTNANAQFAIALYQLAVWERIKALLPSPAIVAGYSLGEAIAYHVAGSFGAAEMLRLVCRRARLMDQEAGGIETAGGAMFLWRGMTSPATLAARDRGAAQLGVDLAIVRRRGEEVFAGPADAIDRLLADPALENPNLVRLAVTTPSHSRYLAGAGAAFGAALLESSFSPPSVPVLSGVDGRRLRSRDAAFSALSRQICSTIRWDKCMSALEEAGIDTVLELGPGNDLAKLIEAEHPRIAARSVDDFADWRSIPDWLATRSS